MIHEVFGYNCEEQLELIMDLVQDYPYVTMDTEFPGTVARPLADFETQLNFQYQTLRLNVDLLKLIQLGITLTNEDGRTPNDDNPKLPASWQFNFKFNLENDMYSQSSIDLLTKSGLNFAKHDLYGIGVLEFGSFLISSGLVLNDEVKWVGFHASYDIGYLLKVLTDAPLAKHNESFFDSMKIFFPNFYDIKYLMRYCKNLKGGLQDLGDEIKIPRVGIQHQAGSDSLLTAQCFHRIKDVYFDGEIEDSFNGYLYGLESYSE
eukprot:NODE_429_length_8748_cov_0.280148.p5 type:complete len:262 gc:universal NODE_429_length_8748_cov_0.280148:6862-6077(-)